MDEGYRDKRVERRTRSTQRKQQGQTQRQATCAAQSRVSQGRRAIGVMFDHLTTHYAFFGSTRTREEAATSVDT